MPGVLLLFVCFFPVRRMSLRRQTIYAKRQEYSAPGRDIFPLRACIAGLGIKTRKEERWERESTRAGALWSRTESSRGLGFFSSIQE